MLTLGIDIGSTASKAVIMRMVKTLLPKALFLSAQVPAVRRKFFQNVLNQADVTVDQIDRILATGYGRKGI